MFVFIEHSMFHNMTLWRLNIKWYLDVYVCESSIYFIEVMKMMFYFDTNNHLKH